MKMWMPWFVLGTVVSLVGVVAAYRLARAPGGAPPPRPGQAYDEPTALSRALIARSEVKDRLTEEVIAGRLSLLEAAAAFRDLDAQGPPQRFAIRDAFPGASSEEEAYCRSVITWVSSAAPPGRGKDVADRLQGELDARLCDGTMILHRQ